MPPVMRQPGPQMFGYPMMGYPCPLPMEPQRVQLEISLTLNDSNLQEMAGKLPVIQLLIDKGFIQAQFQPTEDKAPCSPAEEQPFLARRADPSVVNVNAQTDAKKVKSEPQTTNPDINSKTQYEAINEFTQLKADVERLINEDVKDQIEQQQSIVQRQSAPPAGPPAFTKLPQQPYLPFKPQQPTNVSDLSAIKKDVRLATSTFALDRQPEQAQFSFQRMNFVANGAPNPTDTFRQCFERHRHTTRERISWEMEKVHQNHAKKVRDYWEKHETYQPYLFKRRQLLRQDDDPQGEIIEFIDFSNKRIAEGEVLRAQEEESERSSFMNDEEASQTDK